ncbi:MAG TPA: hypothetical protein VIN57_04715 [Magnetovibrio sp.]
MTISRGHNASIPAGSVRMDGAPMENPPATSTETAPRALVAFDGQTELKWLKLLRPGFRHCFVLVESHAAGVPVWVLYNPLSVGTQIALWPIADATIIRDELVDQGYIVVETKAVPIGRRLFAWRPYTCVEAVKRVLGINASWVWTPWQLYIYLNKMNNQKIILDLGGFVGYNSH